MSERTKFMWMIVAKAPRHEWLMYWTAGATRKAARNAFADQFGDRAVGLATFNRRMTEGTIRYARVVISEATP